VSAEGPAGRRVPGAVGYRTGAPPDPDPGAPDRSGPATVHLVGAGPGTPALLTRRAVRLLGGADVVVADRRSHEPIAALAPAGAERVYVGLGADHDALPTAEVVELLAGHARAGRRVVRLKSGDPCICSRGGEEAAGLVERGIPCELTPGVSAGFAAPLAAGVGRGRTVTVTSGDRDPALAPVHWEALAAEGATLAVLTGRASQGRIAARLMAGGVPPGVPAHVVSHAFRPGAAVVATTLAGLGSTRLPPPAAFVVSTGGGGGRAHP
jgi:uroporphyrin-III C-methyltransferase